MGKVEFKNNSVFCVLFHTFLFCFFVLYFAGKGGFKMAYTKMNIEVKNVMQVIKELDNILHPLKVPIQRTVSDFKSRAPGWASKVIAERYGVKRKDITEAVAAKKSMGKFYVQGEAIDNMCIIFKGRPLTPIHFNMKPKTPSQRKKEKVIKIGKKDGKKKVLTISKPKHYDVSAEIIKGNRKVFDPHGGGVFIAPAASGQTLIPWKRSAIDNEIHPIKTISVPQMVESKRTEKELKETLNKNVEARFNHHLKRAGLI